MGKRKTNGEINDQVAADALGNGGDKSKSSPIHPAQSTEDDPEDQFDEWDDHDED